MKKIQFFLIIVCTFFALLDAAMWLLNNSNPVWVTVAMFLGVGSLLCTLSKKVKYKTILTIVAMVLICGASLLNSLYLGSNMIIPHILRFTIAAFLVYLSVRFNTN